jgi:hypothetical protein
MPYISLFSTVLTAIATFLIGLWVGNQVLPNRNGSDRNRNGLDRLTRSWEEASRNWRDLYFKSERENEAFREMLRRPVLPSKHPMLGQEKAKPCPTKDCILENGHEDLHLMNSGVRFEPKP